MRVQLYGETNSNPPVRTQLWMMAGNQDNIWHRADVTVRVSASYRYVFRGIRGSSFLGDIALDDITLTAGCISGSKFVDLEYSGCFFAIHFLVLLLSGSTTTQDVFF